MTKVHTYSAAVETAKVVKVNGRSTLVMRLSAKTSRGRKCALHVEFATLADPMWRVTSLAMLHTRAKTALKVNGLPLSDKEGPSLIGKKLTLCAKRNILYPNDLKV